MAIDDLVGADPRAITRWVSFASRFSWSQDIVRSVPRLVK